MKKKKPTAPAPADFKHTPFKSLKGLATRAAVPASTPVPPRRKKDEKEDEAQELFLRAAAGARRLEDETAELPITEAVKAPGAQKDPAPRDSQLFLQAMQKMGATFRDLPAQEEEEPGQERRSATSRMKQLKRGTLRIGGELDLHGFIREEALQKLAQFIRNAYLDGQQAVLVITGKGINSIEGPVLQGAAAAWLREQGKAMVAEFAPAPREKGGSGAFVVFLKKQ